MQNGDIYVQALCSVMIIMLDELEIGHKVDGMSDKRDTSDDSEASDAEELKAKSKDGFFSSVFGAKPKVKIEVNRICFSRSKFSMKYRLCLEQTSFKHQLKILSIIFDILNGSCMRDVFVFQRVLKTAEQVEEEEERRKRKLAKQIQQAQNERKLKRLWEAQSIQRKLNEVEVRQLEIDERAKNLERKLRMPYCKCTTLIVMKAIICRNERYMEI